MVAGFFHDTESGRLEDGGDGGAGHIKQLPLPETNNVSLKDISWIEFQLMMILITYLTTSSLT